MFAFTPGMFFAIVFSTASAAACAFLPLTVSQTQHWLAKRERPEAISATSTMLEVQDPIG